MVIAVDIDNVLAEFIPAFLTYMRTHEGHKVTISDIKSNYLNKAFGGDWQSLWNSIIGFYGTKEFDEMPVIKGSQEALQMLKENHQLVAITGRPESLRSQTLTWINKYFPDTFEEVYFANTDKEEGHKDRRTKSYFCHLHGADVIIDDDRNFANECAESGITTVYFRTPYNESDHRHDHLLVAKNWEDVLGIIGRLS